jgi:hypothetical protein
VPASLGGQGGGAGIHGGRRRKGADRPQTCKEGKYEWGKPCSPRHEASGELTGEEEAAAEGFDDGGGSGGAPAGGDPSSRRSSSPVAASPGQQASREGHDRARGRKGKGGDALHRRRRLHGGGKKQRRRRRWNWCSSACVGVLQRQREAHGRRRKLVLECMCRCVRA